MISFPSLSPLLYMHVAHSPGWFCSRLPDRFFFSDRIRRFLTRFAFSPALLFHPLRWAAGGAVEGEGVEGIAQAGHQSPGGRVTAHWMDKVRWNTKYLRLFRPGWFDRNGCEYGRQPLAVHPRWEKR